MFAPDRRWLANLVRFPWQCLLRLADTVPGAQRRGKNRQALAHSRAVARFLFPPLKQ